MHNVSTCHPDRPHHAGGLCQRCYQRVRESPGFLATKRRAKCHVDKPDWARGICYTCYRDATTNPNAVPAKCHPELSHRALGLCEACYEAQRRAKPATRERLAAYRKQNRKKIADSNRDHGRQKRTGVTPEMYANAFRQQGGACAICGCAPTTSLHADHDHATGQFRGLLCGRCNPGIGLLGEDINVLRSAIAYLRRAQPKKKQ